MAECINCGAEGDGVQELYNWIHCTHCGYARHRSVSQAELPKIVERLPRGVDGQYLPTKPSGGGR